MARSINMTRLETVDAFKREFGQDFASFLNSTYFPRLIASLHSSNGGNGIADLPNVMLHGPDGMVLDLCLGVLLTALTGSASPAAAREPDAVHRFPHAWHAQYIVVDAAVLLSDDRAHLVKHMRHMTTHTCLDPATQRHIIVVKNAHAITQNLAFAMRKMIEEPRYTCLFVFTTAAISKMEAALVSRCMGIRCCVNAAQCHQRITGKLGIQVPPAFLAACLKKSNCNISKFLAVLERHDSRSGASMFLFDNFVESRLRTLLGAAEQHKDAALLRAVEDTVSRLELSGVRPEAICRGLVDACLVVKPEADMAAVVGLLAELQAKMVASNKLAYVLEELLHRLVGLLTA